MNLENYQKLEKTGEGSYGLVYKVLNKINNKILAIKKFRFNQNENGIPQSTLREIVILKNLNHPNIIKIGNVIVQQGNVYMIMDYISNNLKEILEVQLSYWQKKSIVKQLIEGA